MAEEKTKTKKKTETENKYIEAKGRRKTSVARVRLFSKGEPAIIINDKPMESYFPTSYLRDVVSAPLKIMRVLSKFRILIKARGGGMNSQAEAVRHGISRALLKFNSDFRKRLKKEGFLTRDQRMKERRKFGLKKARKAPQWSKR